MIYTKALLMTSNENKRREFNQIMDEVSKMGRPFVSPFEIKSQDPIEVLLHKTKDMYLKYPNGISPANTIMLVEDTSLMIEGHEVGTDIKYFVDNMEKFAGLSAVWHVYIGVTNGNVVEVYEGSIDGSITKHAYGNSEFGFDNHFVPTNNNPNHLTLAEFDNVKQKFLFSARVKAIREFNRGNFVKQVKLQDIPEWTGAYQEE